MSNRPPVVRLRLVIGWRGVFGPVEYVEEYLIWAERERCVRVTYTPARTHPPGLAANTCSAEDHCRLSPVGLFPAPLVEVSVVGRRYDFDCLTPRKSLWHGGHGPSPERLGGQMTAHPSLSAKSLHAISCNARHTTSWSAGAWWRPRFSSLPPPWQRDEEGSWAGTGYDQRGLPHHAPCGSRFSHHGIRSKLDGWIMVLNAARSEGIPWEAAWLSHLHCCYGAAAENHATG